MALAAALLPAASACASSFVPPGFRLAASNGYRVYGIFFDGTPREERDELILFVVRKHSAVAYFAPARADETSVSARLGSLGSVDLHFVPSGRSRRERTPCGTPKSVAVRSGVYEGTVDLHGEEGYMRAHATRVRSEARTVLSLVCGGSSDEGFGGHSPGARLTVLSGREPNRVEFVARKNSPTRPARFEASIGELVDGVGITRSVSSVDGPGAFDFDVPAKSAVVEPAAPFAGSLAYEGGLGRFRRVHGDLSVDFPGHSDVRVAGPGARAGLIRYVANPGHPFRLPRLASWLTTRP
ncbi:MAG: hypothetical protein ACOYD4_13560 [Solirubrobacterales bacterium]